MYRHVCSMCVAVAALAGSASASTIQMKYDSLLHGSATPTVKVTASSPFLAGNKASLTVYAGPLLHQTKLGNGVLAQTSGKTIATFCTELSQTVKSSWTTFEAIDLQEAPKPAAGPLGMGMSAASADAIRVLWASVGDAKFTNPLIGAAFQIAIWEIVYDGAENFDLGNGHVKFSNSAAVIAEANNLFNTHLASISEHSHRQGGLIALSSDSGQDQLFVIPLPSHGAMAMVGLMGLGAIRRRR